MRVVVVGLALSVCGCSSEGASGASSGSAEAALEQLAAAATKFVDDRQRIPSMEQLRAAATESAAPEALPGPDDPWGNSYLIRKLEEPLHFELVSAGPDGILATGDDVVAPSLKYSPLTSVEDPGVRTVEPTPTPAYGQASGLPDYTGVVVIARDAGSGDLGFAAVAAHPMVASRMAKARAEVGVVAIGFKPRLDWKARALDGLATGKSAPRIVRELTAGPRHRFQQLLIWPASGDAGEYRGNSVMLNAGSANWLGEHHAVMASNLREPGVEIAVAEAFAESGEQPLPDRLLQALAVAARPEHFLQPPRSAALRVVRQGADPRAHSDVLVDVSVPFHSDPLSRLRTLYDVELRTAVVFRLRDQLREISDTTSPRYRQTLAWQRRIRSTSR